MKNDSIFAKISTAFVGRYRLTILAFIGIFVLGVVSYAVLLKREGFPAIAIPAAFVQVNYFVNDATLVDQEITIPIESVLVNIEGVEKVNSFTTDNFARFTVRFADGFTSETGSEKLKNVIARDVSLPDSAAVIYQVINAAAIDGRNDLLLSIGGDFSLEELTGKAELIRDALANNPLLTKAEVQYLTAKNINPLNGEEVEIVTGFNRIGSQVDGELVFYPAISIGVNKKFNDTGTLELSNAVRSEVDKLIEDDKLEGVIISYGGDFADGLLKQIGSLESNVITGLLAVIVVLVLFINWRAAIVTAIFIPTVLAATFVGLYVIGYSLNVLSLFALILVLGLFVDDGIVIVEAIDAEKKKGVKGVKAVSNALNSVGLADVSGTVTTLLVFLPMAAISGILGEFIRLIPITVILALSLSLIIALTIVPLLSQIMLVGKTKSKTALSKTAHLIFYGFSDLILKLGKLTGSFVRFYLATPVLTIIVMVIALLSVALGINYAGMLKFSIFPTPKDTDSMLITISYPEQTSIDAAETIAIDAEAQIKKVASADIEKITYLRSNASSAIMIVDLTPVGTRDTAEVIAERLDDLFSQLDGADFKVELSSAGPPSSDYPFAMQIFSDDQEVLTLASAKLADFIKEYDLETNSVTDVKVDNLSLLAKIDGRRFVEVKARLSDSENSASLVELQDAVVAEYNEDNLSDLGLSANSLEFDFGQESENLSSFGSALLAMLLALLIMYGLLVLQFNSFLQPFLVFLAIPFSFAGLFFGLYTTNNPLSFFVVIGMTGLIGIVVNNTIMLLDYANQMIKSGASAKEAISEAVAVRFRPLLATSVTTLAGLLPLALSDPFWEPLSLTIIFGLMSSTALVITTFPAFFAAAEWLRALKRSLFKRTGVSSLLQN